MRRWQTGLGLVLPALGMNRGAWDMGLAPPALETRGGALGLGLDLLVLRMRRWALGAVRSSVQTPGAFFRAGCNLEMCNLC